MAAGLVGVGVLASAYTKVPAGPAPGAVTCSVKAQVKFWPYLTPSVGGTNPSTVTGSLPACGPNKSKPVVGSLRGSFSRVPSTAPP